MNRLTKPRVQNNNTKSQNHATTEQGKGQGAVQQHTRRKVLKQQKGHHQGRATQPRGNREQVHHLGTAELQQGEPATNGDKAQEQCKVIPRW